MTAQTALRTALRDRLGPVAREHGYKGSAPTWRRSSAAGDWAVVNVQTSSSSDSERLRCYLNLAFVPEPWLRWTSEHLGSAMPKAVNESLGLYRVRLNPEPTPRSNDGWWEVSDDHSAASAVDDMISQLGCAGWPVLERMFSREAMTERLRVGDLGMMKREHLEVPFLRAEAVMMMDQGMSEELSAKLVEATAKTFERGRKFAERFEAWVRAEASKV